MARETSRSPLWTDKELEELNQAAWGDWANRKVTVWVDKDGQPLQGSVDWYDHGERVEAVVVGAGPFDTTEELLHHLLCLLRAAQRTATSSRD